MASRNVIFSLMKFYIITYNGILLILSLILSVIFIFFAILLAIFGELITFAIFIAFGLLLVLIVLYLWFIPIKGACKELAPRLYFHMVLLTLLAVINLVLQYMYSDVDVTFIVERNEDTPPAVKKIVNVLYKNNTLFFVFLTLELLDILSALFLAVAVSSTKPTRTNNKDYRSAPA